MSRADVHIVNYSNKKIKMVFQFGSLRQCGLQVGQGHRKVVQGEVWADPGTSFNKLIQHIFQWCMKKLDFKQ